MRTEEFRKQLIELSNSLGITAIDIQSPNLSSDYSQILQNQYVLVKEDNLVALLNMLVTDGLEVDLCYIDPPYNTGNSFIYNDKRKSKLHNIWGKHHDWLAFMLPRLLAAKLLMKDEAIISISIDDYEYAHLKILMDNIFGEENYISTIVICRSKNGKGSKSNVAVNHEYLLIYGKTKKAKLIGLEENDATKYDRRDSYGEYKIDGLFRKKGDASKKEDRPNMFYPLYYSLDGNVSTIRHSSEMKEVYPIDSKGIDRRWLWGKEKAEKESWKLYASQKGVVYVKNYNSSGKRIKIRSILDSVNYLNDKATQEIKKIYGEKIFETPKPLSLIKDLIDFSCKDNALILDFFAGTGTTAAACYHLNEERKTKRNVILVEHKYPIDDSHIANINGFKNMADITEYRLKAIKNSDPDFNYFIIN
ncbi:site-specific DNA-methyltransferase [Pantoea eucalypti]|uniref:site-specific DNA-methyltransferase n=1 Tax=Pantoea eucalypti TaxID=470933 RepID=UPI00099AC2F7|nr:site-specific DNA-methyltransferase [Pantoea eucalypti]SKA00232.1 adenine-specific DNA-methyltransferase [Pantoea eucalypti]